MNAGTSNMLATHAYIALGMIKHNHLCTYIRNGACVSCVRMHVRMSVCDHHMDLTVQCQ